MLAPFQQAKSERWPYGGWPYLSCAALGKQALPQRMWTAGGCCRAPVSLLCKTLPALKAPLGTQLLLAAQPALESLPTRV